MAERPPGWREGLAAALAALTVLLTGCASTTNPGSVTTATRSDGWSRLLQVDNRFAVYIRHPGEPVAGDFATFHLAYVYQPGVVFWEDREVAWQEYVAMTVNCRTREVKAGLRRRYAPDGSMIFSDEDRAFAPINDGTAVEAAASARCNNAWPRDRAHIAGGEDWMREARRLLAPPPPDQPA